MATGKDKKKILGEVFTEERIKGFLQHQAPNGVNPDFHLLEKAYRGMKAENFATFVELFIAEGRDINASAPNGQSLMQQLQGHRHAADYLTILTQHGAV